MAKSKKKTSDQPNEMLRLSAPVSNSLFINPTNGNYKDCEWCFKFDDNEPYVFAATKPFYEGDSAKITFTLTNQTNTNIVFKDSKTGKEFKLFVREKV